VSWGEGGGSACGGHELEEAADHQHGHLRAHVGDEQREVVLCALTAGLQQIMRAAPGPCTEEGGWQSLRDGFGACVEEELFECPSSLIKTEHRILAIRTV
jgi:hypothetical protein